jgi:hypothetical protein
MSKYTECPNCGSKDTNRFIYQCTACGKFYGCWDKDKNGCWPFGSACPNEECEVANKYKQVGYITG